MKTFRKMLSWFMVLLFTVSLLQGGVFAEETASGTCGDNATWVLDNNGTLTISGSGAMKSGSPWGEYKDNITSVVIESGITNIGDQAFQGCRNLTTVQVGDTVNEIGAFAFDKCVSLSSINLPAGVTVIDFGAFQYCSALTSIDLPEGLTKIESMAFSCAGLTSLTLPASVQSIEGEAFSATKLTSFSWPEQITTIPYSAFESCSLLTSIEIPDTVQTIESRAFSYCDGLTSFTIPDGVSIIDEETFKKCSNLNSVVIPASVTAIKGGAFEECLNLQDVYYSGKKSDWDNITISTTGLIGDINSATILQKASKHYSNEHEYVWTETGDGWSVSAVDKETSQTTETVTATYEILTAPTCTEEGAGRYTAAFTNAELETKIKDVVLSATGHVWQEPVWKWNNSNASATAAFTCANDSSHTETIDATITAPDETTEPFFTATVTGPDGKEYTSQRARSTGTIDENINWYISENYNTNKKTLSIYGNGGAMHSFANVEEVPWHYFSDEIDQIYISNVTNISDYAFYGLSRVSSIEIVAKITSIGAHAFEHCSSLTAISLPESLGTIGESAFASSGITTIVIPESTKQIFSNAFSNCSQLETVIFFKSLTSIGNNAFSGCSALTTVRFEGLPQEWESVQIGSGNTALYNATKRYNQNLSVVIDPEEFEISLVEECSDQEAYNAKKSFTVTNTSNRTVLISATLETPMSNSSYSAYTSPETSRESGESFSMTITPSSRNYGTLTNAYIITVRDPEYADYYKTYRYPFTVKWTHVWNKGVITTEPTCTEPGVRTFTCYRHSSAHYTEEVPALGHAWGEPEWTWNDERTEASALFICGNDASHMETVNASITSQETENGTEYTASVTGPDGQTYTDVVLNQVALVDSGTCEDGLNWAFYDNGRLTISGNGEMMDYNLSNTPWHNYKSQVLSIMVEEGVKNIGTYAFANCKNAERISLPLSVTAVGSRAFYACNMLNQVQYAGTIHQKARITIEDYNTALTDLEWSCIDPVLVASGSGWKFYHDGWLDVFGQGTMTDVSYLDRYKDQILDVTIEAGITEIAAQAFQDCGNLVTVELSEGLQGIDQDAFRNCAKLTTVELPAGLISIGNSAFCDCISLTVITLPDSVTTIENYAFQNCKALAAVRFSESLTSIGDSAFNQCSSLLTIELPKSVNNLEEYAFYGCSELKTVVLPDSLTRIPNYAFSGCTHLNTINIPSKLTSLGEGAFYHCEDLEEILLPDTITEIPNQTFAGCSSLSSIHIPSQLTRLGDVAFSGCTSLQQVTLPDTVESIGDNAFSYCQNLSEITLPAGLKIIPNELFRYCSNLKEVKIPRTVEKIGDYAFYYTSAVINALPEKLTYIGNYAFAYCRNTTVEIPESVNFIGEGVFEESTVQNVSWPEQVTSLSMRAFHGCQFNSFVIPDNIETIESEAFGSCTGLQTLYIPKTVSVIKANAFANAYNLTDIYFAGTQEEWNAITVYSGNDDLQNATIHFDSKYTIMTGTHGTNLRWTLDNEGNLTISGSGEMTQPVSGGQYPWYRYRGKIKHVTIDEGILSVSASAFADCNNMTEIELPNSMTTIGSYAFSLCESLETVRIPGNVTTIEEGAFSVCSKLKTLYVPNGMKNIGEDAFLGCDGLSDIYYGGTETDWTEINIQNGNESLTQAALHAALSYTVTFLNDDDSVLTEMTVAYGDTPVYPNETPQCTSADPRTQEFVGWEPELIGCTKDTTYKAIYKDLYQTEYIWEESDQGWSVTAKATIPGIDDPELTIEETVEAKITYVYTEATCEENGRGLFTADFENKRFGEQSKEMQIQALGHIWSEPSWYWSWDDSGNPTAEAYIYCTRDSSHCHNIKADVTTQTKAATCTEDGKITRTATITFDGATLTDVQEEPMNALGHQWGEALTENYHESTCTEDGGYEQVVYCSVCGEELSRQQVPIEKKGHRFEGEPVWQWSDDYSAATAVFTCANDPSHVFEISATIREIDPYEPTCQNEGFVSYQAQVDFEEYGSFMDSKTVTLPQLEHNPGEITYEAIIEPTCVDGSHDEVVYCTYCGKELSRRTVIDPAMFDHEEEKVQENYQEATCTENGSYDEVTVCKTCGKELSCEHVTIPAYGHELSSPSVENIHEPTCTQDGGYDKVWYCQKCGQEAKRETHVDPARGHSPGEPVQGPSELGDDYYDVEISCTVCGEVLSRESIPKARQGWVKDNGKWYYYNSGVKAVGWQKIDGKWYYLDSEGVMQTGWTKVSGKWYYFNASGAMLTGWQKISNTWYYFNPGGDMVTGWKQISGKWYYFNTSGAMVTGWQTISGKTYFFKSGGAMAANEWCNGWWLNSNGTWTYKYKATWRKNTRGWWYGDDSGWYAKNTTTTIDSKSYSFDANGYMK